MGLEPEGDSTAVWRHLPVDTKKRDAWFTKMRIKCNVTSLRTQNLRDFTANKTLGHAGLFVL